MEKILLFQVEDIAAIRAIAAPLHIKVEPVGVSYYKESLGSLYRGVETPVEIYDGEVPAGSLMVFCGVRDKALDKVLAAMKKKQISVTYKAVMTQTNARWNILRIYFEMERERQAYNK